MKQQFKIPFVLLLITIPFMFACKEGSKETPTAPTSTDTASTTAKVDSMKAVTLVTVHKGEDAQSVPHSDILLSVDGKQTFVKTIAGEAALISKTEYERYQIPAEAVAACGAYYAGAGDYFYVVINNGTPEVYAGWQEEPQGDDQKADTGYHWEKMELK